MTKVNFDRVDTKSGGGAVVVPDGYAGLSWNQTFIVNPTLVERDNPGELDGSGYETGVTSGHQAAYSKPDSNSGFFSATDGTFTLKSIEMTSAWNIKEDVLVLGFSADGALTHQKLVTITDKMPTLVRFNWDDVQSISFSPEAQRHDPDLHSRGDNIIFDDIRISNQVAGDGSVAASFDHGRVFGEMHSARLDAHAPSFPIHHDGVLV